MTPGQTRVFVLMLLLLALEAARKSSVSTFIRTALNNGNAALSAKASGN
ncbi:MAG TPA: hypothetical protein VNG51_16935 [Ktedonobacteraceae bacterium]|nr:hypothetical protein [Ktedonobacteraceae bacterium]